MASTVYDVVLKYSMTDVASKAANALGKNVDGVAKAASRASNGIGDIVKGAVAFFGMKAGYTALIGYNRDLELSVTSLATTMFGFGVTSNFEDAMKRGTALVADYTQVAKTSVGETKDFVAMHQSLQGALLGTGLSMKDIKDVTIGATVASQVMGEQAEMTALDIKQMAMGTMTARDRVGGLLAGMYGTAKGMKGFGFAEWNKEIDKFKKAGDSLGIQKMLTEAVNSPALKAAANKMGNTFEGRLSTMKDTFAQLMGKVGKPLFERVTAAMEKINMWADKNADKIGAFVDKMAAALGTAFDVAASVFGFIVDNIDPIMTAAKMWLAAAIAMKGVALFSAGAGAIQAGMAALAARAAAKELAARTAMQAAVNSAMGIAPAAAAAGAGGVAAGGGAAAGGAAAAAGGIGMAGMAAIGAAGVAGYAVGSAFSKATLKNGITINDLIVEELSGDKDYIPLQKQKVKFAKEEREAARWAAEQYGLLNTVIAANLREASISRAGQGGSLGKFVNVFGKSEMMLQGLKMIQEAPITMSEQFQAMMSGTSINTDTIMQQAWGMVPAKFAAAVPVDQMNAVVTQAFRDGVNQVGWGQIFNPSVLAGMITATISDNPELAEKIKNDTGKKNSTGAPKITIQKIEVESNDPDRFVFGLEAIARDAAVNVSQAKGAFRNG